MLIAVLVLLAWLLGSVLLGLAIGRAVALSRRGAPRRPERRSEYSPAA